MGLSLFFSHPDDAWQKAHDAVKSAIGDVRVDYEPHVTLIYMGSVRQGSKIPEIKKAITEALDGFEPVVMKGEGVAFFTPSDSSDGDTPIVIKYAESEHLSKLAIRMLRALAPYTHAKQFLDYAPHATLGYAKGTLSTEQRLKMTQVAGGSPTWIASELILAEGTRVHARFNLTGVAKADEPPVDTFVKVDDGALCNGAHSNSQCMYADCKAAPEVECIWADGRGRAWFCKSDYAKWKKEEGGDREIVRERDVDGKVGAKYGDDPVKKGDDSDVKWGCEFIAKSEDDKQIVTGIVLEPDEVDLQNDTISPDEIEAAAHRFLSRYNRLTKMGLMHQMFGDIGVELVESWIAREDTTMGGAPVKKGSWLMSVHVTSKALWGKVKDGAITGFSIGGTAKVD